MKGIEKILMMLALALVSMKRRLPETRRLSSGITTLTLAGIVLLVAAGSASADTAISQATFGDGDYYANTVGERYYLTEDLICNVGNAGIIIDADGVTIDGMGLYKITGAVTNANCKWADETHPCTKSGIYNPGFDNVMIKNLEIESFCTGIALAGSVGNMVSNNIVDNCKIHDNGFNTTSGGSGMTTHGIHACLMEGDANNPALTITGNDIHHNEGTGCGCGDGGNGIFIYGGSPDDKHEYCNISYNDLHHNAKSGFWTKMMLDQSTITHNNATENGGSGMADDVQGGIVLRCKKSSYNFVAYNNASNNGGDGIYGYGIYVGGSNNTIWDNTANDNTASGICMGRSDGSDYNNVSNNTACGNKGCCCFGRADIGTCGGGDPLDGCCGNYGDNNTCDICFNCDGCNDIICPYHCPGTPEVDLEVIAKSETWNSPGSTYTVHYTIANRGYAASVQTHAGIWIDGTLVATQAVQAISGFGTYDGTSGPHPVDNTVVNGATYIDNVTVCADIYDEETREDDETNNCTSNIFGGPDLVIYPQYYVEWIDLSWKTYNLSYTVKNVGDIATTHPVWVNFTEIHGYWKDCVDPNPIPAGLQLGVTTGLRTVGPFVMGGYADWVEDWVNFNYSCPVNNWDVVNYDRGRFMEGYPAGGPCWDVNGDIAQCGDADCSGVVNTLDAQQAWGGANACTCAWAADVNCGIGGGVVNTLDAQMIWHGSPRNCCEGCERW